MKRRAYLAATASAGTAATAGCLGTFGFGSQDGITLPTVETQGSPGDAVPIDPDDRVALLDFFATWCAPCKPQMSRLNALRDRYDQSQLSMVSITQERDRQAIRGFWQEYDGNWPVAMDAESEAFAAYGVDGVPTLVVRAPDGEETMRHRGLAGTEQLIEGVEKALE